MFPLPLPFLCSAVLVFLGGTQEALPLSRCPQKCNMRGQCSKVEGGKPRCTCFRGYSVSGCMGLKRLLVVAAAVRCLGGFDWMLLCCCENHGRGGGPSWLSWLCLCRGKNARWRRTAASSSAAVSSLVPAS